MSQHCLILIFTSNDLCKSVLWICTSLLGADLQPGSQTAVVAKVVLMTRATLWLSYRSTLLRCTTLSLPLAPRLLHTHLQTTLLFNYCPFPGKIWNFRVNGVLTHKKSSSIFDLNVNVCMINRTFSMWVNYRYTILCNGFALHTCWTICSPFTLHFLAMNSKNPGLKWKSDSTTPKWLTHI